MKPKMEEGDWKAFEDLWDKSFRDLAAKAWGHDPGAQPDVKIRIVSEARLAQATVESVEASKRSVEASNRAANEARKVAFWTKWLALATFVLAAITGVLVTAEVFGWGNLNAR